MIPNFWEVNWLVINPFVWIILVFFCDDFFYYYLYVMEQWAKFTKQYVVDIKNIPVI